MIWCFCNFRDERCNVIGTWRGLNKYNNEELNLNLLAQSRNLIVGSNSVYAIYKTNRNSLDGCDNGGLTDR